MNFLAALAQHIVDNYNSDYQQLAIILPNKRAQQNLYAELAQRIDRPAFAPTIFSMDELVKSLSPLQPLEKSELLVKLFHVYHQCPFGKDESFMEFIKWGRAFLKDIEEIDLYAKDAEQIYSNLAALKELDFFGESELSPSARKYLEFYSHLGELYTRFKQELAAMGQGYTGMIYRDAAENIAQYAQNFKYGKIIYAGLNALSPTEQAIAKFFHEKGALEFFFDMDHFYFDNEKLKISERAKEIQKNLGLKEINRIGNDFSDIEKDITICGAGQSIGQVYAAIEAIKGLTPEQKERTAVVFADESLLVPFIHAYPFNSEKENITMSYPAQHSHSAHLLHDLLAAAQNYRRLSDFGGSGSAKAQAGYYHKDVLPLLQNPIVRQFAFNSRKEHGEAISKFLNRNQTFLCRSEITDILGFEFPDLSLEGMDFLSQLIDFLQFILKKTEEKGNREQDESIERPLLARIILELENVQELLRGFKDVPLDFKTIQLFINEQVNSLGLPFLGNPTQGMQIMGLLETRTLDFDTVIVVGANEGILPAAKSSNSMLLFELKRHYGLPTYENNDAIFGYHFFRLLQRASRIHLIFNNDSSNATNEESRFVRQLEFETKHQNLTKKIRISRTEMSVQPRLASQQRSISITKTTEIVKKLKKFKYSATSLSEYIKCPLKFYLLHIAEIKQEKDIDENIEQNVVGKVIHKILEKVSEEIIKKKEEIEKDTSETHQVLDTIFTNWVKKLENEKNMRDLFWEYDSVKGKDLSHGKLLLATEVVKRQVTRYFEEWKKELKKTELAIRIIGPEMKISHKLKVDKMSMMLKGTIDLVEYRDGKLQILDYKTGTVHELDYKDMATLFSDTKQKQLLQLLMYAYLYSQAKKEKPENISCAIVSFQSLMKRQDYLHTPSQPRKDGKRGKEKLEISKNLLTEFEKALAELFKGITDKGKPLEQTADTDCCKHCEYKEVCGR